MRMEMTSFFEVLFNEVAQAKFVHTVSAGYVTASVFVIGVSAWYLLRGRHIDLARRSITVAAAFGLASALSVVVLGDESGYSATDHQKMKLAAMEGMWDTHDAPASFTLIGIPDQEARETKYAIHIPWVMGIIGTRSLTQDIPGINDLEQHAEERIRSGMIAYEALMQIRTEREAVDPAVMATFEAHSADLGYAFLLRKYTDDPTTATEEQILMAAEDTIPTVWPLFWAFRIMVGLGFAFIGTMAYFFIRASFKRMEFPRWSLHMAVWMIPTPWIAAELGWFVAEFGRQPWTVDGVLPTAMSVSALSVTEVAMTLAGFVAFYTVLFVIEMGLMLKYIRKGPFQDVEETEQWMADHAERLRCSSNAAPIATPAE
jgi:cytochrome bd ubiquinol oxidase subunit I